MLIQNGAHDARKGSQLIVNMLDLASLAQEKVLNLKPVANCNQEKNTEL